MRLITFFVVATLSAGEPDAAAVGSLGDPLRWTLLADDASLPLDQVRAGLLTAPALARAGHPLAPRAAFTEALRQHLIDVLHHAGHAAPAVATEFTADGVRIRLAPGPRQHDGRVVITGLPPDEAESLRRWLTEDGPEETRAASGDAPGRRQAVWRPGTGTIFCADFARRFVNSAKSWALTRGRVGLAASARAEPAADGAASLHLDVSDPGRPWLAQRTIVTGLVQSSEADVLALAALPMGRQLFRDDILRARLALERSGRFAAVDLGTDDAQVVRLTLDESRRAPPLGQPLTPAQTDAIAWGAWLERWGDGDEPSVLVVRYADGARTGAALLDPAGGRIGFAYRDADAEAGLWIDPGVVTTAGGGARVTTALPDALACTISASLSASPTRDPDEHDPSAKNVMFSGQLHVVPATNPQPWLRVRLRLAAAALLRLEPPASSERWLDPATGRPRDLHLGDGRLSIAFLPAAQAPQRDDVLPGGADAGADTRWWQPLVIGAARPLLHRADLDGVWPFLVAACLVADDGWSVALLPGGSRYNGFAHGADTTARTYCGALAFLRPFAQRGDSWLPLLARGVDLYATGERALTNQTVALCARDPASGPLALWTLARLLGLAGAADGQRAIARVGLERSAVEALGRDALACAPVLTALRQAVSTGLVPRATLRTALACTDADLDAWLAADPELASTGLARLIGASPWLARLRDDLRDLAAP
jgi:hypothetical protein